MNPKCDAYECRERATRTVGRKYLCDSHAADYTKLLRNLFPERYADEDGT